LNTKQKRPASPGYVSHKLGAAEIHEKFKPRSAESRVKRLDQENIRLKKLLAEAELDKAILKEVLEGNY